MEFYQQLNDVGLRATTARLNILKILDHHHTQITADELYLKCLEMNLNISLTTVYKCLADFEAKHIVKRIFLGKNKSLYLKSDKLVSCNILSLKTKEPIGYDSENIRKQLENFLKDLDLDIASVELNIYTY